MSDRIAGLILLALAVAYGVTASGFQAMIGDPLGPSVFPLVLAFPMGALSLYLLLRPDPEPAWPRGWPLLKQAAAIGVFIAYAFLLEPLGFIVTTFIAVIALGSLLGATLVQAAAAGLGIAVVLFILFHYALSLPLPTGVLRFLLGN